MRIYAIAGLMAVMALAGFQAQASTNLLAVTGLQQGFNWQTEWGGINFNGSPDPGIDSTNLQPKADIKRVVSEDGTQTANLSGLTTFKVDLNGDGILDSITDGTGYFGKYQKTNPPLPICVTGDGCYVSIYLFDQNTSITSGDSSTTKYNTTTVYSERILGWNVVAASDFEAWATGKDYQLFNNNPVLATLRNNNICYQDEIAQNNNQCVKYLQFVGDKATGTFMDLYDYKDSGTQPQYDTRFTYTPFDRDVAVLSRGKIIGGGFGHKLDSGMTIDLQIADMTYSHSNGQTGAPAFHQYRITNSGNQSLFVPTNSDKELSSFINAARGSHLPGVAVCTPPVKFTDWCGDLTCPTVVSTTTTIAAQRLCISATSDYRDCSECVNAAKAANGVGWPDDWAAGCSKTQECAPSGCFLESGWNVWVNANQCIATMTSYLAGNAAQKAALNAVNTTTMSAEGNYSPLWIGIDTGDSNNKPYVLAGHPPDVLIKSWCNYVENQICQLGHVCLAGDSLVALPDGTTHRIDAVKVGDTVLGFATPKGKLKPFKVVKVTTTPKQDLLKINGTLSLTPNHRVILADGKELQASQLKVGDVLLGGDRAKVKIATIETVSAEDTVYNLVLDKPAIGFVANGVRVTDYEH